jgi:hypothetical protein
LSFFSAITQRLSKRRGRGHDAGVDLADLALHRAGVLVLDDASTHLPSASARCGRSRWGRQLDGQQRQLGAAAGLHQRGGRCRRISGTSPLRISVMRIVVGQHGHHLLHGVAGAQLRHLAHEARAAGGDRGLDRVGAMAGDDQGAVRPQRRCRCPEHAAIGTAGQAVQHLGQADFMRVPLPAAMITTWSAMRLSLGKSA